MQKSSLSLLLLEEFFFLLSLFIRNAFSNCSTLRLNELIMRVCISLLSEICFISFIIFSLSVTSLSKSCLSSFSPSLFLCFCTSVEPSMEASIDIPKSDRNFNFSYDSVARPSKKPKIEEEEEEVVMHALPLGFLDPIPPNERSIVLRPHSTLEHAISSTAVVPYMSKQFWKAGDYEGPVNNTQSMSLPVGMDHVRVHPRFLHSNATSHKWALGALAELLDNSLDEVRTGATYVNVDVLNSIKDGRKMLLVEDNGGGMTPDKLRGCMSLGYSVKSKLANTIGQYGNGFKTSTMRLGADVIVFTRCPGQDGRNPTQSIGMLSYTFLMETGKEDIVVPMVDFEKRGQDWGMMVRSSPADWTRNMETLVRWSPFSTEEHLLQQFDYLNEQGTRIIIYNLWEDEEGQLELDFDTDLDDIQIRGANRDPKKIEMAKDYPNSRHFLTYRHSLRSYAAILYLTIPNGFRIILRAKEIMHHNIVDDMMLSEKVMYKPTQATAGVTRNNQNQMMAVVTLGFVKDAKDHIDVQGFNVYHKNRLIKPFWRVWNAAGSDGRGVIGVLEADFVEPAHDKQGFERTTVLSRLENRLIVMQKKYWSTNCQEIGYAKRCKTASDTKTKPSIKDKDKDKVKSPEEVVASVNTIDHDVKRVKLTPIRKFEPLQNDEYPSTSRKYQIKETTSCLPSEEAATNVSAGCNEDIISNLKKENLQLKERLLNTENAMVNERDKNVLLKNQVLKAEEKIQDLDKEQVSLIDIFSEERQRRDVMEETLRNRWKEAMNTVEELRRQIKVLENKSTVVIKREL